MNINVSGVKKGGLGALVDVEAQGFQYSLDREFQRHLRSEFDLTLTPYDRIEMAFWSRINFSNRRIIRGAIKQQSYSQASAIRRVADRFMFTRREVCLFVKYGGHIFPVSRVHEGSGKFCFTDRLGADNTIRALLEFGNVWFGDLPPADFSYRGAGSVEFKMFKSPKVQIRGLAPCQICEIDRILKLFREAGAGIGYETPRWADI